MVLEQAVAKHRRRSVSVVFVEQLLWKPARAAASVMTEVEAVVVAVRMVAVVAAVVAPTK